MIQENNILNVNQKNPKTCIQIAVDEKFNLYVQATNTKRLKRKWVEKNLTNKLIAENSILATYMQVLYDIVALQAKSKLQQIKHNANKQRSYQNLKMLVKHNPI